MEWGTRPSRRMVRSSFSFRPLEIDADLFSLVLRRHAVAARSGEEQSTALREKITEAKRRLAQEGILNISGPKVAVADEVLDAIEEHKTVDVRSFLLVPSVCSPR